MLLRRRRTPRVLRLCVDAMRLYRRRVQLALTIGLHVLALFDLPQLQGAAGAAKKCEIPKWPSDEVTGSPLLSARARELACV